MLILSIDNVIWSLIVILTNYTYFNCGCWYNRKVFNGSIYENNVSNCFRVIVLIPEEAEDMWQAYNIIREGDRVRASTIRY